MPQAEVAEVHLVTHPDRMIMIEKDLRPNQARAAARDAVRLARRAMPKMSGAAARGMQPLYGKGYFGISWSTEIVWYQDHGTKPFTMRSLAGKVIPMWIDDPTGQERRDNPKAKTRVTESGKMQVLIFRRAALIGQRKKVYKRDPKTGLKVLVSDKPASYPGAPGRIAWREASRPWTRTGKRPGAIHPGNVGVRWRHPGLKPRSFLNTSMTAAAQKADMLPSRVYIADKGWRNYVRLHGEEFK
ncbi:hypothetical protein QFZ75_007898 [Streptomyces sp. V3I8]|uniref:hypothetical protein n=1 Tax=Streptomyces sp. V3I8 TaxID=3042279 RepID=UPI00277DE270|nr:hypothetical protein [Streptomyces sp. V3I8]MDQ1041396.1 hypothetical protein [Streptomyces sp. V3I8]